MDPMLLSGLCFGGFVVGVWIGAKLWRRDAERYRYIRGRRGFCEDYRGVIPLDLYVDLAIASARRADRDPNRYCH